MSRSGKVTVVGAGFYGSTTALRLAEYDIFETVVLTDIVEGKPEGLALDMNQSRSIEGFETKITGATTTAGVRARTVGRARSARRAMRARGSAQTPRGRRAARRVSWLRESLAQVRARVERSLSGRPA